jgi:hypothetical protein
MQESSEDLLGSSKILLYNKQSGGFPIIDAQKIAAMFNSLRTILYLASGMTQHSGAAPQVYEKRKFRC